MKIAKYVEMPKKEREEKITNRILINISLCIAAFVILRVLSNMTIDFSSAASMPYFMLGVSAIFLIGAIAFYAASKKKSKLKNYGHVFVVAFLVSLYLNAAMLVYWAGLAESLTAVPFIKDRILNTANAYTYTNWLLGIYLVGMLIYHIIFVIIVNKKAANARSAAKASKKMK